MTPLYKIAGLMLLPSGLVILLLLLALIGPRFIRRFAVAMALALLTFGSIGPLSGPLLAAKEQSLPIPEITEAPDFIVVLGNGHVSNPELALVDQLYYPSLARITQAVALARVYPLSQLVFTGYAGADTVSSADKGAELAISLGVDNKRILRFPNPRNTQEEVQATTELLSEKQVLLVTSAAHLPRALALFHDAGVNATGYPTGHLIKLQQARDWHDWWPKSENWLLFERWAYEELAIIRQHLMAANSETNNKDN